VRAAGCPSCRVARYFAYCCIDPFTDQLNLAGSRSHLPLLCAKMVFTVLEAGAGAGPDAKVQALRHLSVEQMSVEQMSVEQMSVEQMSVEQMSVERKRSA